MANVNVSMKGLYEQLSVAGASIPVTEVSTTAHRSAEQQ